MSKKPCVSLFLYILSSIMRLYTSLLLIFIAGCDIEKANTGNIQHDIVLDYLNGLLYKGTAPIYYDKYEPLIEPWRVQCIEKAHVALEWVRTEHKYEPSKRPEWMDILQRNRRNDFGILNGICAYLAGMEAHIIIKTKGPEALMQILQERRNGPTVV